MEKILSFMIELGLLYDEEVQKPNNKENERAIYDTAKLFLLSKGINITHFKSIIFTKEYIDKYENIYDLMGLLTYMEWQEKQNIQN